MKTKLTLFKMRVKEASKILSVSDIYSWNKMESALPVSTDVTRLPKEAEMEDIHFSEISVIYMSVN